VWEEFVRRFRMPISRMVLATARRWTQPSLELIDDLIQETLTELCRDNRKALRAFEPQHDGSFPAYLKAIAFSVTQDHFRSLFADKRGAGKRADSVDEFPDSFSAPGDPAREMEKRILYEQIVQFLSRMSPEETRERDILIFSLYYRQGYTAKQIADVPSLGLSAKGVESVIFRLTNAVRKAFGGASAAEAASQ